MDPISLGLAVIGASTSLFGGIMGMGDAKKARQIEEQIAVQERRANEVRREAMNLSARRQQIENIRNTQRMAAISTSTATNQGAQFSSGAAGGQAQVLNTGYWNSLGITQNWLSGEKMFGINDQISSLKSQLSGVQGDMYTDQAISGLGKSIMGMSGTIGNLAGGFGGGQSTSNNFDVFNYGGKWWPVAR